MNKIHRQLRTLDPVRLPSWRRCRLIRSSMSSSNTSWPAPLSLLSELTAPGEADLDRLEPMVQGTTRQGATDARSSPPSPELPTCSWSWLGSLCNLLAIRSFLLDNGHHRCARAEWSGRRAKVAAGRRHHTVVADAVGVGVRAGSVSRLPDHDHVLRRQPSARRAGNLQRDRGDP